MIYEVKIDRKDGTSWTIVYDNLFGAEKCTPEHVSRVDRCVKALMRAAITTGDRVSLNAVLHTFTAMIRYLTEGGAVKIHVGDIQSILKSMGAAPFGGDKTKGSA